MNARTEVAHLQSAIPFAVRQACQNFGESKLEVKPTEVVNLRRKLYDVLKDWKDEGVYLSEIKPHMAMFGYSSLAAEVELRAMYNEGMLTRTKVKPYLYRLKDNCPVPSDEMVKLRNKAVKVKPVPKAPVDMSAAIPSMAPFNKAVEILATDAGKFKSAHYGNLSSDIQAVRDHLAKMRMKCTPSTDVDPELASDYNGLGQDLDSIMEGLADMESRIAQIAQMARLVRSNPL